MRLYGYYNRGICSFEYSKEILLDDLGRKKREIEVELDKCNKGFGRNLHIMIKWRLC